MDFENIKDKITKKHIIIGTSALLIVAGGITAGVITSNSDEQPVNAPVVETQPTTEAVTTAATTTTKTTTTKATTTTVVSTTKKSKKTEKKEDKSDSNKTEVKEDNNDYSYDEPQYEEPAQQETPKQETPAPAPDPAPEPEPEPVYDVNSPEFWGYTGHDAELFNYALSQGCSGDMAQGYVENCNYWGESNVVLGNPAPEDPNSYWGIWHYVADGDYWSTW